jgi:hypothetical protein
MKFLGTMFFELSFILNEQCIVKSFNSEGVIFSQTLISLLKARYGKYSNCHANPDDRPL